MKILNGSIVILLAAGVAVGCGGSGGGGASGGQNGSASSSMPARDSLPPAVRAQLDSGNAAYRAGDYEEASRHYRATVQQMPDLASGWFGIYMAAEAMGDSATADSAKARMGEMGRAASAHMNPHGMPAPGDTTGATPRADST